MLLATNSIPCFFWFGKSRVRIYDCFSKIFLPAFFVSACSIRSFTYRIRIVPLYGFTMIL